MVPAIRVIKLKPPKMKHIQIIIHEMVRLTLRLAPITELDTSVKDKIPSFTRNMEIGPEI